MNTEEIAEMLAVLEADYKAARDRYFSARNSLISHMQQQEAKLQLTSAHMIRLRTNTQVKSDKVAKSLLRELVNEVPLSMRMLFIHEVGANVSALREVAKLGGEFKRKVDLLLEERPNLVIEPLREADADELATIGESEGWRPPFGEEAIS
jgi:hypothetical protein